MSRFGCTVLLSLAVLLVACQSAAAKAPTKAYVLTADQTRSTVISDEAKLLQFGGIFWAPWNWPVEQLAVGTPLVYRYLVVAISPGADEDTYVYFVMPGHDGRPGYYFEAGSDLGAWVSYPDGIDESVVPNAPPSTGDAVYVAGDPRPSIHLPASGTGNGNLVPWAVGSVGVAVVILLWAVRRRRHVALSVGMIPDSGGSSR